MLAGEVGNHEHKQGALTNFRMKTIYLANALEATSRCTSSNTQIYFHDFRKLTKFSHYSWYERRFESACSNCREVDERRCRAVHHRYAEGNLRELSSTVIWGQSTGVFGSSPIADAQWISLKLASRVYSLLSKMAQLLIYF